MELNADNLDFVKSVPHVHETWMKFENKFQAVSFGYEDTVHMYVSQATREFQIFL